MSYHHLNIDQRESILENLAAGASKRQVARIIGCSPSTITRELKRNSKRKHYSPYQAQNRYEWRRKRCHRPLIFSNEENREIVSNLICAFQWSPEQIANRLKKDGHPLSVSTATIYRAFDRQLFEVRHLWPTERGFKKNLRHKGHKRCNKNQPSGRGKMKIPHAIEERPAGARDRSEAGHLEADTVIGKAGGPCLVTLVDRKTRFLYCRIAAKCTHPCVEAALMEILTALPPELRRSITPDRGAEFRCHGRITQALRVPFYFPLPHQPWQRGTNENTNGLLREYFPKGFDFRKVDDEALQEVVSKLNARPRKCLNWFSPAEVHSNLVLHLD